MARTVLCQVGSIMQSIQDEQSQRELHKLHLGSRNGSCVAICPTTEQLLL